jgi:hypothetical protein
MALPFGSVNWHIKTLPQTGKTNLPTYNHYTNPEGVV